MQVIASGPFLLYNGFMSLRMVVGEDFPRGHWMLDSYPLLDCSGYERHANSSVVTNLLTHAGAETGNGYLPNNTEFTRTVDTTVFHSGTRSIRYHHNQSARLSRTIASAYGVGTNGGTTAVTAGNRYGYGLWARANLPVEISLNFGWRDSANTSLGGPQPAVQNIPANTWTWVYAEAIAPATATQLYTSVTALRPVSDGVNAAVTDYAWFDSAVFVENPSGTISFFDGNTPGASWTGAVNASTSTIPLSLLSNSFGTSLAKGAERSLIINNSNRLFVDAPVWKQGKEYLSFSVEVFVRPVISDTTSTAEIQIFGNDGHMDGLVLKGTVVSFVTKYADGSEARASFDLMDQQSFAAVGVHTERKNLLFINGDQVAEIELTPEQRAGTFIAPGDNFSSGATTSTNSLMLNSLSIYDLELDEDSVMTHYANAQDTLGAEDVAIDYRGALLEFAPEGQLSPFFTIEYASDEEWGLGHRVNCAIDDGTLLPAMAQGVSVPGYWETVIPLGNTPSTIFAANLIWEGTGAIVTTSRDGELYEPARKGLALSTVPRGTNGENEYLFVRVAFPGGIANDPSFFDNMVFSLYASGTISNFSGREVVLDKATPEADYDVIDFHQNWGVELENGTVTIKSAPGDTGIAAQTIEVWAQKGGTFTDNIENDVSVISKYSNGGAFKAYANGEWQLRHYVLTAPFSGNIVFSGTGQIGHVILYPSALSAAVIKEIYDSYTGKPKIQVDVDEVFDIHEFPGAVDIYEYDWSIESSG